MKYSLVILLSGTPESITITLYKPHNASLSGPFKNSFVESYYSNMRCQRSTLSVVNVLYVRFLWSVYTVILCPNRMVHNYFRVSNILKIYLSVVVYLMYAWFNLRE